MVKLREAEVLLAKGDAVGQMCRRLGVTTGMSDAVAVLIDSAGQLGTAKSYSCSSMQFKHCPDLPQ